MDKSILTLKQLTDAEKSINRINESKTIITI